MARVPRGWMWVVAGLVLLASLAGGVLYWAAGRVPEFYQKALAADAAVNRLGSDRMLQQATGLASDLKRGGRWQAVFTAEEINGWLAVDLVENHAQSLPAGVKDPRVAISPARVMLGCRYRSGVVDSVLWVEVEPYLVRPSVLAIRIRKVRAGGLPVPMQQVLGAIDEAVRGSELKIEWSQADSDPVAVVSLPPQREAGEEFTLDAFRLADGKIVLGGTSRKRK